MFPVRAGSGLPPNTVLPVEDKYMEHFQAKILPRGQNFFGINMITSWFSVLYLPSCQGGLYETSSRVVLDFKQGCIRLQAGLY